MPEDKWRVHRERNVIYVRRRMSIGLALFILAIAIGSLCFLYALLE